jgi:pimeloyl-ACP methyl ester carboxylesterase
MKRAPSVSELRSVTFLSEDSVHLRGSYASGRGDRMLTLILVHDAGADRSCWEPYVPLFRTRGWNVLTFDLRGHGESVRQDMRHTLLKADAADLSSPHVYPADIRAAVAFAARQEYHQSGRIALLGVGFGSDLAYAGSARGWGGVSTVCISLDDERARALAGPGTFAPRSCYLMYGADDPVSASSGESFGTTAAVPSERYPYAGTAKNGLALWAERQPEILARAIAWIEKTS